MEKIVLNVLSFDYYFKLFVYPNSFIILYFTLFLSLLIFMLLLCIHKLDIYYSAF